MKSKSFWGTFSPSCLLLLLHCFFSVMFTLHVQNHNFIWIYSYNVINSEWTAAKYAKCKNKIDEKEKESQNKRIIYARRTSMICKKTRYMHIVWTISSSDIVVDSIHLPNEINIFQYVFIRLAYSCLRSPEIWSFSRSQCITFRCCQHFRKQSGNRVNEESEKEK